VSGFVLVLVHAVQVLVSLSWCCSWKNGLLYIAALLTTVVQTIDKVIFETAVIVVCEEPGHTVGYYRPISPRKLDGFGQNLAEGRGMGKE